MPNTKLASDMMLFNVGGEILLFLVLAVIKVFNESMESGRGEPVTDSVHDIRPTS